MNLIALSLLAVAAFANVGSSQPSPPIPIWPAGAPGAKGSEPTDVPTLTLYAPQEGQASGAFIVVCPGGGYGGLADHEGPVIARWLNTLGISAGVLKYRLAPRYMHPAMMNDVNRAIRTVRANCAEWKIDPKRIGVMGFSAGGHLASTAATHYDAGHPDAADAVERVSSRPNLAILCYPVVTMEAGVTHGGSRNNLLGPSPSAELISLMSNEKQVTKDTPPTFLFHTTNDGAVPVENALRFALACAKAGVPFELHSYEKGPHGVGLATNDPILSTWTARLADWLKSHGFCR